MPLEQSLLVPAGHGTNLAPPLHRSAALRRSSALHSCLTQMFVVAALIVVSWLLAFAHLASLARPGFLIGAITIAAFYKRRSPWEYLTVTLWFWSVSPFARRVVDYYGGFTFNNLMLVTPNLLTLLMLKDILTSRQIWRCPEAGVGFLALLPMLYGLFLSFFRGGVFSGLVGAADWFTPLLYYFYLINLAPRVNEMEPHFRFFVASNMVVVASYGLYQYFDPMVWDVQWVLDTRMSSVGDPVPFGLKPFSTLNGPGVCAGWLSALLVLSLHFRTKLSIFAIPATALLLALTLVRGNIAGTVVALVVAAIMARAKIAKSLVVMVAAVVIVAGVISVLDPRISKSLADRFDSTKELSSDASALARAELFKQTPGLINAYPAGLGIDAVGRAAAARSELVIVDSGPLAIYMSLGWIAGTFYLGGFLAVTAQAILAARQSGSRAALALAMAALSGACVIVLCNVVGLQGITIWLSAGFASAIGMNMRVRGRPALLRRPTATYVQTSAPGRKLDPVA